MIDRLPALSTQVRVWIGAAAWAVFTVVTQSTLIAAGWTLALIAFVALVLSPLALDLVAERRDAGKIARSMRWALVAQMPAALLLALGCAIAPGWIAFALSLPWTAVTALLASVGLGRALRDGWARPLDRLSTDVGLVYLFGGGLWLLADRAGLQPLRFEHEIVALTAAHFHFAGFLLPILAGLVLRRMPEARLAARAVVGVVLGTPAVAIGITVTQLGGSAAVEGAAGCGLALSGLVIAVLQLRVALDAVDAPVSARALLGLSAVALFFGMMLAGAYALRAFAAPLPWLGLPQMRALHGTLNALGFALCGTLGWRTLANLQRNAG